MKGPRKRPQATNERTNVWCKNCKGHGHVANECPTPKASESNAVIVEVITRSMSVGI
jgi:peptide methionine sulfoxide reductase MsrB